MFKHCWKVAAPLAALALGLAAAACGETMQFKVDDTDGVPLAGFDMSGAAPTKLVLAGPDEVVVSEGNALDIKVSGDAGAVEALRFHLENGTLGIMRDRGWTGKGKARIAVTMPPLRTLVLAGSGDIQAATLVDEAEVKIAGSGKVAIAQVAAGTLEVNVLGSGTLSAAGSAEMLDFDVAGSGTLKARELKVGRAEIDIAGSGGGEFASDGKVAARIAGSGDVTVHGRADCSIEAMGSGQVRCRPADGVAAADTAPAAPAAPQAPPAPEAPEPSA
jgi:hypothetical protein